MILELARSDMYKPVGKKIRYLDFTNILSPVAIDTAIPQQLHPLTPSAVFCLLLYPCSYLIQKQILEKDEVELKKSDALISKYMQ